MNISPRLRSAAQGFTLIELLVALAVLVVLTVTAIPAITDMRERQRITSATEAINAQLSLAKSEASKRSQDIYVAIEDGTNWAVGVSDVASCDPEGGGTDCTLTYSESNGTSVTKEHAFQSTDYPGVTIVNTSPSQITFAYLRRTATNGTVTIRTTNNTYESRLVVSSFGRILVCSPTGATKIGRYPDC